MRIVVAWLRGTVVALALAGEAPAGTTPCAERPYGEARLTPAQSGPARLAGVHKASFVAAELDDRPVPQVSPDGAAYFTVRHRLGLQFGPEPAGSPPQVVGLPEVVEVGYGGAAPMPFAWQADSRAVFGASQPRMYPRGGWALGGWQPLRIWRDGRVERLPRLSHPSGELDSLQWAGGRGLALAQFGTRGGLYRPERKNPEPAFAFIDAVRGRVLATFRFDRIPGVRPRRDGSDYALFRPAAAVVVRPDGRLRAVVQVARGPWVILDQGRPPRLAPIPGGPAAAGGVALSADGRRVLITPSLQASGMICERNPNCPKPTPVEGSFAALYDLETGERLWELRATVTDFWTYPVPALNADGSLALVGLPEDAADAWPRVGLVSTRIGAVVQTLCAADSSSNVLAFLPNARMSLSGVGHVALYEVAGRGR
ncbi:MAG: hypothetical protein JF588_07240 [Caulobacterales bacterium]|nr:hypothetical protein [Caulobacterales bacterium]